MKKLVVAVDIDGVILNFMQSMARFVKDFYNVDSLIPYCHTQHYVVGMRFDESWANKVGWDTIEHEFAKAGYWSNIEPMGHIHEARTLFTDPRFDTHIVTMLDPVFTEQRKRNLERVLNVTIDPTRLHLVPLTASKQPIIEAINPDVFIEDSFGHLEQCSNVPLRIWIDNAAFDAGMPPAAKGGNVISALHFDDAFTYVSALAARREQEYHASLAGTTAQTSFPTSDSYVPDTATF